MKTAITDWHVNVIRLPLAQDRWFGKAREQKDGGEAYRKLVDTVVELCARAGCYVILDLHWSDAGEWGKQIGQHVMPDAKQPRVLEELREHIQESSGRDLRPVQRAARCQLGRVAERR